MPPSRASAIASRASVTVSIAAETSGIESESDLVRRVAVETSFGSTSERCGTSRTSSKVSPSRAKRRSSSTSRSSSICPRSNPSKGSAYQRAPTA